MHVKNHLLYGDDGTQIQFEATQNHWPNLKPIYLVIHYTADNDLQRVVRHFKTRYEKGNASAHLIIDKNGDVIQMVKFNRKAWHAGRSSWGEIDGLNHYSIGIELMNAGRLEKTASGQWLSWYGEQIDNSLVVERPHKNDANRTIYGWEIYTQQQIQSLISVAKALHNRYNFLDVLGHDDISPGRKNDPGPAFNMVSVGAMILGR